MQISLYVLVHVKVIPWKLASLIHGILELCTRKAWKIFVYKHTWTIEYVKNSLLFKENANFTGE